MRAPEKHRRGSVPAPAAETAADVPVAAVPAPPDPAPLRWPPTADDIRAAFDGPTELTVGLEEEAVLLDPSTFDLLPAAAEVAARCAGDPAVHREMPASQLEVATPPAGTVGEVIASLAAARRRLLAAARGTALVAAVAVHPAAAPEGVLSPDDRYAHMREEYAWAARRQLVASLQIHVAVRPAEVAVQVHDALRSHLPSLAALAAAAPFAAGADTGLASVRPLLCTALPRQGIPPVLGTVDGLVESWRWAHAAGATASPKLWWWEARLHPGYGTLEVRVPDVQATVEESGAVAALVHCLVADLADRARGGYLPPAAPGWRIEENRWSACRHGVEGTMADLRTGEPRPTRAVLEDLLESLAPTAGALGCSAELAHAGRMLEDPAPARHRRVAAEGGVRGLCAWLAARYRPPAGLGG